MEFNNNSFLGKLRGNVIGKEERTSTDKKRERRNKKSKQRAKRKAREAKEIVGGGTKAAVKRAIKEGRVQEVIFQLSLMGQNITIFTDSAGGERQKRCQVVICLLQ